MRKILRFLFGRLTIVIALLLVQVGILLFTILELSSRFTYVYAIFVLLSAGMVIWIINQPSNPTIKLSWVIVVMVFPVFGGLLYLLFGTSKAPKTYQKKMIKNSAEFGARYPKQTEVMAEIAEQNKNVYSQCSYIQKQSYMPVYKNTYTEFLPLGEDKFKAMKRELEKAERYIFLEYFIIQEGIMWDSILEILKRKAAEGVDVRVIFDDAGCINTLPSRYKEKLEAMGIKCVVFIPLKPVMVTLMQNRDHRKITVIDGHTAFTGGVNLADEYINAYEKHGHWKDSAILIKGEAVLNLTLTFLEMWNFHVNTDQNFDQYIKDAYSGCQEPCQGYVQPYTDSPLDDELLGESVYLNIINNATDYLYITSPYLVVDNELLTAFGLAAKRGVDVRIITPHIEDKWYVHMLTQSYYKQLIMNGVKIYEYTPGFIHSKTFLCDDQIATVGTVNLDFRSLYHHFECGTWMYKTAAVVQMKEDVCKTLEVCTPISLEQCKNVSLGKRIFRGFMRLMAPLM